MAVARAVSCAVLLSPDSWCAIAIFGRPRKLIRHERHSIASLNAKISHFHVCDTIWTRFNLVIVFCHTNTEKNVQNMMFYNISLFRIVRSQSNCRFCTLCSPDRCWLRYIFAQYVSVSVCACLFLLCSQCVCCFVVVLFSLLFYSWTLNQLYTQNSFKSLEFPQKRN